MGIATEAVDRLHTTAESHMRTLVVEVMGRHSGGGIALHAGIAGGANVILIPERAFDIDDACEQEKSWFDINYAPIVVVAEGAVPKEGQMAGPGDLGTHRQGRPHHRAGPRPTRRHP